MASDAIQLLTLALVLLLTCGIGLTALVPAPHSPDRNEREP
jgi:hypothetical protein